jgi:hypothetical protein
MHESMMVDDDFIESVKKMEIDELFANRFAKDYLKPQPISANKIKLAFFNTMEEYLKSDYNITSICINTSSYKNIIKKYAIAIQFYYHYSGNDSKKYGKEVVSLWVIDNKGELKSFKRIW